MARHPIKRDEMIEAVRDLQPFDTIEDMADKVGAHLGRPISRADMDMVLAHIRKYCDAYGFTIPHVKRGAVKPGETGRYYCVSVDKADTSFRFDQKSREHFDKGGISTVATIAAQSTNHARQLQIAIPYERSPRRRELLEDLETEVSYIAKKARKALKEMRADAAKKAA